jgi:hypothetical protein
MKMTDLRGIKSPAAPMPPHVGLPMRSVWNQLVPKAGDPKSKCLFGILIPIGIIIPEAFIPLLLLSAFVGRV